MADSCGNAGAPAMRAWALAAARRAAAISTFRFWVSASSTSRVSAGSRLCHQNSSTEPFSIASCQCAGSSTSCFPTFCAGTEAQQIISAVDNNAAANATQRQRNCVGHGRYEFEVRFMYQQFPETIVTRRTGTKFLLSSQTFSAIVSVPLAIRVSPCAREKTNRFINHLPLAC